MVHDVHAHIDLYYDRKRVISYIERENINTIAMTNLPEIYKKYQEEHFFSKYIRFALGFHPELVLQYYSQIDCFLKLLPDAKYIGEIGLDFSREKTLQDKNTQIKIFNEIIKNCKQYTDKKILNIHSRNAAIEVIEIINCYHGKIIMHWFSGKFSEINNVIKNGYFFSVNNQMVDSRHGRDLIGQIPINKLLIESDAPFTKMSKFNYNIESLNYVYKQIATIKKLDYDIVKRQLDKNFYSLVDL